MRQDVSDQWTVSVDCRGTGEDHTTLLPPGTIKRPVLPPDNGEIPVGEVRAIIGGTEVCIVAEETGRPDVIELTIDMLSAVKRSEDYRRNLCQWLTMPRVAATC